MLNEQMISGVRLSDTETNRRIQLALGGLFMAIGHTPATAFLDGQLELDSKRYIKLADPYRSTTSVDGVFAAFSGASIRSIGRRSQPLAWECKAALDAEVPNRASGCGLFAASISGVPTRVAATTWNRHRPSCDGGVNAIQDPRRDADGTQPRWAEDECLDFREWRCQCGNGFNSSEGDAVWATICRWFSIRFPGRYD
ncbi:MAG: hypothetical protein R3E58_06660 [Phycisphaerae bacterium]